MIKKLQHQFIIIMMSIAAIMLCIIFSLVYFFTKAGLEKDNISMMHNIANQPFRLRMLNEAPENIRLPFLILQLDPKGILTATGDGSYDLSDEEFLKRLFDQTLSLPELTGTIKEYNLRFCKAHGPGIQTIIYSDITSELATLRNLLKTCALIAVISLLIFFALSILLSHWITKPIDIAWKQQRQFVADASHELKTPLTVIMTNAELMQSPDYDEENRAKFCAGILTMSVQMRRLVEQMLELARTEDLQTTLTLCKIDFSTLISDAILPFEPTFFEKGLILETNIEEALYVTGDSAQLRQAIDILLDNAHKYSIMNGTTHVVLKQKGSRHIILCVANEGPPIAADDLKNLFKRFYRADKVRTRNGSFGLGLSIAENIILQHKGKIWAESVDGINSFFIELPRISL